MTVASGQLPYEYDIPLPLRACNGPLGISGVHLESAQFVLNSELRKFNSSVAFFTNQWDIFSHELNSPSGYEPKANGATLNGLVGGPAQVEFDNISRMRGVMLEGLFEEYEDFCPYNADVILQDWIQRAYPNSPSGYAPLDESFLRPILQADGDTYTPSVFFGNAVTGIFEEVDIHWLAGSGIFLDIDFGEVMFNPYPIVEDTGIPNAQGLGGSLIVQARPFYPSFQKTDGSTVTLNGFEDRWPEQRPTSNLVLDYDHVNSGAIRFHCYCVFDDTEYKIGDINSVDGSPLGIYATTESLNFASQSIGFIGNSPEVVPHSKVFLTPTVTPTGVYRSAPTNPKSLFPFTAIESGIAGQWPKPTDIAFSTGGSNEYRGYQVFDSCFWIIDKAFTASVTSIASSGLAIVSPYTGHYMWDRFSTDVAAGTFSDTSSTTRSAYWHTGLNGIVRAATDNIKRVCQTPNAFAIAGGGLDLDVDVATFNDDISTVTTTTIVIASPTFSSTIDRFNITDLEYDGTSYYFVCNETGGLAFIVEFNSALTTQTARHDFGSGDRIDRLAYVSNGVSGPQRFVTYGNFGTPFITTDLGIRAITLASPPTFGTEKNIDISSHIGGTLGNAGIHDIIEISGETEVDDGVYVLFNARTTTVGNRLYIARIEEDTTTWNIVGLWRLDTNLFSTFEFLGFDTGFLFMEVN